MNQFLDSNNPFFRFMGKVADVFLLNLMWVVCSLPIITAGAATTAAMYEGMRLARGEEGYVISRFWKSFRLNFKQATKIHVLFLAAGALLAFDMMVWMKSSGSLALAMIAITTVIIIVYAVLVLYTYAVLARFENTIIATMKNALLLAIANFPITLLILAILAVYLVMNYIMILFNFLTVFIGLGFLAYLYGVLFNVAFRKFAPLFEKVSKEVRPILEDVELQPKYPLKDSPKVEEKQQEKNKSE